MLKRTITYENYDGIEITEDIYFNLTKSELALWESSEDGGLSQRLQKIINSKSGKDIMRMFYDIVMQAYGEKTPDGRRFVKSQELSKAFSETSAFDILFSDLLSDPEKALAFVRQILPADLLANVEV